MKISFIPSSKSIVQRYLALIMLENSLVYLHNFIPCGDTQQCIKVFKQLGVDIKRNDDSNLLTVDARFLWQESKEDLVVDVGDNGTLLRVLCGMLSLRRSKTRVIGSKQLKKRPLEQMVEVLRQIGVKVKYLEKKGQLPLEIRGGIIKKKFYYLKINQPKTSQYISSFLLLSPFLKTTVYLEVIGKLVSESYVHLTEKCLKAFDYSLKTEGRRNWCVYPQEKTIMERNFYLEADASSAVYWWSVAVLYNKVIFIKGLSLSSHQPDIKFLKLLEELFEVDLLETDGGVQVTPQKSINTVIIKDIDALSLPDSSLCFMILALFSQEAVTIYNISHLKYKESNRIQVMVKNLQKIGAKVEHSENWIKVFPLKTKGVQACIKSFDDHRIAMSFAILMPLFPGLSIDVPECVNKSYPDFWKEIRNVFNEENFHPLLSKEEEDENNLCR